MRNGLLALAAMMSLGCTTAPPASGGLTGDVVYIKNDQLYTFTIGSREERKLVELPAGAVAKDPVWSPDGQRVVFSMYPPPQRGVPPGTDLYSVRRDGSDLTLIRQHTVAGEMLESPYFAPDGQSIVYSRFAPIISNGQYRGDIIEIVRLELNTGNVVSLVRDAIQPTISPDGKKIAYIKVNPQTASQSLWMANADGSSPQQLVAEDQFVAMYWPRISPDGAEVAFAGALIPSIQRPGAPALVPGQLARPVLHGVPTDVYKVRTDGSKYQQVAKLQEDDPTTLWSVDGRRLLVIGAKAIYAMNPDGQELVRLREPGGVGGGDWRGK
ncbi:MAG: hypothetical protein KatS3mg060_2692 [Dehalococcoidia bacterium]|nr:MAG: hypothetical protein KatS3mg060_2692 [Dehalococcoidia bacterium]